MGRAKEDLLDSRYYRTYAIAGALDRIVKNWSESYLHFIDELFCDNQIFSYLPNFQRKKNALQRFCEAVVWHLFCNDVDGPTLVPSAIQKNSGVAPWDESVWVLPIEDAFETYGIEHGTFAEYRTAKLLPALPADFVRHRNHSSEGACGCGGFPGLADEYYEYWNEIQLFEDVEGLLERIADEVFFVLFANRSFLCSFNGLLASHIDDLVPPFGEAGLDKLFAGPGVLRRVNIPGWAREAVEFRDRGRCAYCKVKLGSIHTPINRANFDHMVPLAEGGLNDVTNLQLVCDSCNAKKGKKLLPPGHLYERWYTVR